MQCIAIGISKTLKIDLINNNNIFYNANNDKNKNLIQYIKY